MNFGLVHASYSLPEWQAVKLTFFTVFHDQYNQLSLRWTPSGLSLTVHIREVFSL